MPLRDGYLPSLTDHELDFYLQAGNDPQDPQPDAPPVPVARVACSGMTGFVQGRRPGPELVACSDDKRGLFFHMSLREPSSPPEHTPEFITRFEVHDFTLEHDSALGKLEVKTADSQISTAFFEQLPPLTPEDAARGSRKMFVFILGKAMKYVDLYEWNEDIQINWDYLLDRGKLSLALDLDDTVVKAFKLSDLAKHRKRLQENPHAPPALLDITAKHIDWMEEFRQTNEIQELQDCRHVVEGPGIRSSGYLLSCTKGWPQRPPHPDLPNWEQLHSIADERERTRTIAWSAKIWIGRLQENEQPLLIWLRSGLCDLVEVCQKKFRCYVATHAQEKYAHVVSLLIGTPSFGSAPGLGQGGGMLCNQAGVFDQSRIIVYRADRPKAAGDPRQQPSVHVQKSIRRISQQCKMPAAAFVILDDNQNEGARAARILAERHGAGPVIPPPTWTGEDQAKLLCINPYHPYDARRCAAGVYDRELSHAAQALNNINGNFFDRFTDLSGPEGLMGGRAPDRGELCLVSDAVSFQNRSLAKAGEGFRC